MQILRKYSRVEDRGVLEHTQDWFTQKGRTIPTRRSTVIRWFYKKWSRPIPRHLR